MGLKSLIKQGITMLIHPLVSLKLIFSGSKNFSIGSGMMINKRKYLRIGNNTHIGRDSRFLFVKCYGGQSYNPSVEIGSNVSIGNRFSALSAAKIVIEDNALIASDVLITSENHGMDPEITDSYATTPLDAREVHIGKGCWLGEKVSIMPGVTLGERTIVAANAVVTKSFPDHCIIGGIPAKIIKKYDFEGHRWVGV